MNKKLETERLELRIVEIGDLENIHILHSIPAVDEYNTLGIPTNIQVTEILVDEWIEAARLQKAYVFRIRIKSTLEFIGLISIQMGNPKYKIATVWYKIKPDFWGKGYATEALKEVFNFGFGSLDLHRIEAGCAVDNIGSIKVLEKAGMMREGHKRKILPLRSGWSDNYEYAILDKDWEVIKN